MTEDAKIHIGPFILNHVIAEGGMGQVWRGVHSSSALPVAVKVLTGRMAQRPRFRQTFRNEARAMSRLNHPNIVRIFEFGQIDTGSEAERYFGQGAPFIAMEYIDGQVAHHGQISNWQTLKTCLITLLDALAHAHARGVIHRDLKPNNLLLTQDGTLKLSDFGIAFATDDAGVDIERLRAAGTPEFMAPEQCHGQWRDFGPWTDLYAVGCVAYALACGFPPFQEEHPMGTMLAKLERDPPPMKARCSVPSGFERWVRRLLRRTPRHRFQRAADAAWALKGLALPAGVQKSDLATNSDVPSYGQDTLIKPSQDTMVTGSFDTDASFEGDAIQDLEPNFEGVSASHIRATRAPIPIDWTAGRRAPPPPLENVGLELFALRQSALVGRSDICDVLWERLRQVHTFASPRAVVLRGPSGVGKSRIAEWLCERAHELGAATVMRAHHAMEPGATEGLVPMLMRHLRCTGLDRRSAKERLTALLASQGAPTDEADGLTELMLPSAINQSSGSENTIRFFSIVERRLVLGKQLERMALDRTVIVWIDDAQWGHESLDFVHWLLERRRCPFLILLTVCDEVLSERPVESMVLEDIRALENTDFIDVSALDGEGHSAFLESLLCLEPSLAHAVQQRTAGNPMFAIQLLQNWVNEGYLVPGEAGFRLRTGAPKDLPKDLSEVWFARLREAMSRRSQDDITALELAAVLGQEVDRNEWSTLCRLADVEPSRTLIDDMFRDRLLRPIDEESVDIGFVFVHAMLREAIERHAANNNRLFEHHRFCVALVRGIDHTSARLARHLRGAGDLHASLGPLRRAVQRAISIGDHRAANTALIEWRDTLSSMGVPSNSPGWLETEVISCVITTLQGQRIEADEKARALVEMATGEQLFGLVCQCQTLRGQIAIDKGEYDMALIMLNDAMTAYQGLEQPDLYAHCQEQIGRARGSIGDYAGARTAYSEAEKAFLGLDDVVRAAYCLLGLARIARQEDDLDQAKRLIESAKIELEKAGARAGIAAAQHAHGEVYRILGLLDAAERHYREARETYANVGSPNTVRVEFDLSFVLIRTQRFLEAQLLLDRVISAAKQEGRAVLEMKAKVNLMTCSSHSQDWYTWDHLFEFVAAALSRTGVLDFDIADQLEASALSALSAGQGDRAIASFQLALSQWQRLQRTERMATLKQHLIEAQKLLSSWS